MKATEDQREVLKQVKLQNEERVQKGLTPVFKKKRELKEQKYLSKFESLQKEGKLDSFMDKQERNKESKNYKKPRL